jgi:hypothetical protein
MLQGVPGLANPDRAPHQRINRPIADEIANHPPPFQRYHTGCGWAPPQSLQSSTRNTPIFKARRQFGQGQAMSLVSPRQQARSL